MPWALLALLAGAGGIYYTVNKGRATNTRWELHFPASSTLILSGLMDAVTPLGGTVLDQGAGVYVVSVPAKVDLSHALPPALVPPNMVISGASLGSYLQADDRMPEPYDVTGSPPRIPPGRKEAIIGGMAWDGHTLRPLVGAVSRARAARWGLKPSQIKRAVPVVARPGSYQSVHAPALPAAQQAAPPSYGGGGGGGGPSDDGGGGGGPAPSADSSEQPEAPAEEQTDDSGDSGDAVEGIIRKMKRGVHIAGMRWDGRTLR